jgi:periplasmic protein CpxP/Spy
VNIHLTRKLALMMVAAVGLLFGGIWAGRLVADTHSQGSHFSAERIFNRIADRLALSDSQRAQIKLVLKSHKSEILAQAQAQVDARKALKEAISANTVDENLIRQRVAALATVEGNGAVLRARIRSEIWPILSNDQKAKIEAFHRMREQKGDEFVNSIQDFLNSN